MNALCPSAPCYTRRAARKTTHAKCQRCWRHVGSVAEFPLLCTRCVGVVSLLPVFPDQVG